MENKGKRKTQRNLIEKEDNLMKFIDNLINFNNYQ